MSQTGVAVQIPTDLLIAGKEQNLCPFIGAGFSKNVDVRIPSAVDLNKIAAGCLGMDSDLLDAQSNGDYQLVAEYLITQKKFGKAALELDRAFHDKAFDVRKSDPHIQLTLLNVPSIFTTNWDSWIERAFTEMERPIRTVVRPSDYSDKSNKEGPYLFKLHGDISIQDSLVYSISSYYERMSNESAFDIWLSEAIFHRSFLFMGYSFYDPNLRLLWYRIKALMERTQGRDPYIKFPKSFFVSNTNNKLLRSWLSQIGVEMIVVNSQKSRIKDSITYILEKLISAQNS